jgi:hypothetical protein
MSATPKTAAATYPQQLTLTPHGAPETPMSFQLLFPLKAISVAVCPSNLEVDRLFHVRQACLKVIQSGFAAMIKA